MVYTRNVPLATQTIANSQPQILGNFQFLEDSIGQEHNFDDTDPTKTYHLRASMPNSSIPVSLPAGTAGIYYVRNDVPQFWNGDRFYLQTLQTNPPINDIETGTAALNTSTNDIVTVPANSAGTYYVFLPGSLDAYGVGLFVSDASSVSLIKLSDPSMTISDNGLKITGKLDSNSDSGNYKYILVYYTP